MLVNRVEPMYLGTALWGNVWFGIPGYNYLGSVSVSPEAPVWVALFQPIAASTRCFGAPPASLRRRFPAGDLSTSPPPDHEGHHKNALQPGVQVTT